MTTAAVKRASFAVEDMKEGGGNLFGSAGPVRATLQGRFSKEAPENYPAQGNPIFAWVDFTLAGDGPIEERRAQQTYSLGAQSGDNFTISEDGNYLIPNSDDAAIVKDCKFGTFAASLQNEGVPKNVLQDFSWDKLNGLDGDFKRVADKERSFTEERKAQKEGGKKFPPSTLVCVKLHAMPGEKAKTGSAPAASAPATTAAAPVQSTGDIDGDALNYLTQVLNEKGGSIQRGNIVLKVSQAVGKDPNRQAIAKRAAEESFIQSLVDAGLVIYGASEKGQPVTLVK